MKINMLIFLTLLPVLALLPGCGERDAYTGSVRVRVLDGLDSTPIEGACVTVPETGERFLSRGDGRTDEMLLPVIPDAEYDALLPAECGRITLLVTAEGYTPYLLLYARVRPNEARRIDVLMFPDDGTLPVFTVIEAPDADWCGEFAERFMP